MSYKGNNCFDGCIVDNRASDGEYCTLSVPEREQQCIKYGHDCYTCPFVDEEQMNDDYYFEECMSKD